MIMGNRISLFCLFFLAILSCSAQSLELINALKDVNGTLKNYTIGTDEFRPYDIKEHGDRFMFKKFEVSIDYPNFILEYHIGGRISYPGWVSSIKEGKYRLVIPIDSSIDYPASYDSFGTKRTSEYQISITNSTGIEKTTNDKSSIVTRFSLYGDEILTTKKLSDLLKQLQSIVVAENFKGRLTSKGNLKRTNNTNPTTRNTVGKKTKSRKYGQ